MRYLFARRYNLIDGIALAATVVSMHDGHLLTDGGVWLVGVMISCLGELAAGANQ